MRKITFLTILTVLIWGQNVIAQAYNPWQTPKTNEAAIRTKPDRKTIPREYKVLTLDFAALKEKLKPAAVRDANFKLPSSLYIDFPFEDGTTETFNIEKTYVLAPELEAQYPEIQSYYGVSRKNPLNKIYISMDPSGFHGLITGEKTIYIDPYSKNDVNTYMVYDRSLCDRNPADPFVCNADVDTKIIDESTTSNPLARNSTDAKLRTYRLAVACTSEYSAYYGNTIAGVLAAVNTTITRVNSVYRRDFAVIFQIVASENRLIYINNFNIDATPDPDPYDNYDGQGMLNINTGNITGLIGVGNYDMGHVFSTGGGGIAGTGPCASTTKGSGVTGIVTPQYDPFDIDYVCHEMGHQFGAGHTQNNNCQRATTSAMEPGSASTIMGYAGICAPNVQGNSDAYFHAISIQQMTTSIAGHTCEVETAIANSEPVVTAAANYTIPKSTPFILTGSATDAEGDPMTYNWEQMNNETTGTMPPVATNAGSPNFRSFWPTTTPSRVFPNMAAIVANTTPTWEVLPSVARTLNFRLTVRDNSSLGGQTNQTNSVVTVNATAGPFLVTAPNAGTEIWYVGETTRTVTWNVAGTSASPVSTANVAIKLSTDGGFTYPITLLASTANDGSEVITVPNAVGKNNRIKVEAVGNIYFDISNANFEIKANSFELTTAQATVSVCKPASAVFTVNYMPAPSFTETTTFSVTGLPAGASAVFSPTTRTASGSVSMTVNGISGVAAGVYPLTFTGTSASATITLPLTLKVFDNTIGTVTLTSPVNGATNQQTSSLLQWSDLTSASSYLIQISTDPTFATVTETTTVNNVNSYQTTSLAQGTINYWRIKPINACVSGTFSEVFVFQIANDLCRTYSNVYFENNDKTWDTGSNNAVSARIDVPDDIQISDVNFTMTATHPLLSDIKMQFSGPTGIFAEIYNRDCSGANVNVTFDDSGTAIPVPCTTGLTGTRQSSQSLSKFNGSSSLGTWVLLATDRVSNTSGGTFNTLSIAICGKLQINNNITATINDANVQQGGTITVGQSKLLSAQPSATAVQLIYTITQVPSRGTLKLSGTALALGNTFTQADINNNLLTYVHNGVNTTQDAFKFSVKGNNTALLGNKELNLNVCSIAAVPTQTNVSCNGGTTGAASVVASGGTPGYTYDWTPGNPTGDGTASVTGLTAGTWTCTITDAGGCTFAQVFTISQPNALVVAPVSQTNVSCNGNTNGAASVSVSGGTSAYSYNWTPGNPTGDGTASVTGLTSGTWTCTVTDANGCSSAQVFTISQPNALVVAPVSQTNVSCNGNVNGAASVSVSGGTSAYSYNWTPGNPAGDGTASVTGLTAGTWTCTVTDANGCSSAQVFTISQPNALVVAPVSQTNVSCNGNANGAASVSVSGGTSAYSYNWTPGNPTGDGTASVTGLTAGTWTCTVTDANGCSSAQVFTISQPNALVVAPVSQTNVSCNGNANGAASVSVSGGTSAYSYNWTPGNPTGDGTASVTGLTAGTWTCIVTDANGCSSAQVFTISQPNALVVAPVSQTNILCNGNANGAASVSVSGGTSAYSYNWTPGNPTGDGTASVTGLTAGTWTCTVTDANGCSSAQVFTISQPNALVVAPVSQTNVSCNGNANGAASVTVSGGTSAYSYNWTPGNPTGDGTASVTGLTAGTWTCTVTDANGCSTAQVFTISQPNALVVAPVSQTNVSCNGNANGAASVTVSGGTSAYSYNWTPGNPTGDGTASVTGLTAGTWTCTITDANGCSSAQVFTISQPNALVVAPVSQTNVSCNGNANGAASVSVSGGTSAYSYNWTPGNPTGDGTASVTGLTSGTWTCTVTDANGCSSAQVFTISQPNALVVAPVSQTNVSCNGNANGAASVTVSGGTAAYSYNWTPGNPTGDGTASVTGLTAGTWTCIVTDANGCSSAQVFTISQPNALVVAPVSQTNVSCNGNANGAASVSVSGGTSAYSYNWTPGNPTGDGTASVTGLTAGTWTCIVTDANGCSSAQVFTISQPNALVVAPVSQTNVSCNGNANGAASVSVSGGTSAYSYNWTPGNPTGDGTASVTGLTAGTWTCTVTDANGCSSAQVFTISQPNALVVAPVSQTNVSCNGNANGAASVSVSGGTSAYSYNWTPGNPTGDGTASVTGLTAGTWTCTVTDANGCSSAQVFTISQPNALVVAPVSQTNVSCNGNANGAASVSVSGGTAAYSYNWTPGNPTGDGTASVTGLTAGTWTCTVTDANGCSSAQVFTISQPTTLNSSVSKSNVSCYGEANGSITVIATGGSGTYSYSWSPSGGNAATASNLAPGTYTCTILDTNGCSTTQTATITQPVITTWDGTTWSNGYPVAGTKAVITANYTSIGDLTACKLDVTGTAIVTVLSGHDFNIANKVTVAAGASLTFQNNANLVQVDNVANSGSITSKRNATMRRLDYVYWSSPVAAQNLKVFSPQTVSPPVGASRFYILDEPTNDFVAVDPLLTDFAPAKGYNIRAPNNFTTALQVFNGSFAGVPNNGTIQTPVTVTAGLGYNLIGNPYPSTVDGLSFLAQNPGTLHFWTHTNQNAASGANYASFNLLGGTASQAGGAVPNGIIQTGQGFLLQTATPGNAIFTNAMRLGNNDGQFFRNANTEVEKHRIWLNLTTPANALNQILVGYMTGATADADAAIDGKSLENGSSISSLIGADNYVIQGRSLPFDATDIVPLSFKALAAGTYSIGLDHVDGLFSGAQNIYLKDNLTGITQDIKAGNYTFASAEGTFSDRFAVVYQNAALGTEQPVFNENSVVITKKDGTVSIYSSVENLAHVTIFDLLGRKLYDAKTGAVKNFRISNVINSEQVILVKVQTEANHIITKKAL